MTTRTGSFSDATMVCNVYTTEVPMQSANPKLKSAPYDLVIGGCFYKHCESGVEIRLSGYSGRNGTDPHSVVLQGYDKHGNVYTLTEAELYQNYLQYREQEDFTDPVDPRLPYVFDLFWDIKTISQLKYHLDNEVVDQEMMDAMAKHNICINE